MAQSRPIPAIMRSDYDEELANRLQNEEFNNLNGNSSRAVSYSDEEEEDRDIIEALTRAHPTNAEINVDEMIALDAAKHEDSAKENVTNAERNVDQMIASSAVKHEDSAKENVLPATMAQSTELAESPKRLKQELLTDDEMADMEVSRLTSSLESRKKSVNRSILKKPTASFAPAQPPPGKLPDVSGMSFPRLVPRGRENNPPLYHDTFELPVMKFQPLREMSFSADLNSSECLPTNGTERRKRANRLNGESDRDSSPYSNGSSPDDRLPRFWKTDGSIKKDEDINQILKSFHVVENTKENSKDELDPNDPSASTSKNVKDSPSKDSKI